jgi:hypothetical protein
MDATSPYAPPQTPLADDGHDHGDDDSALHLPPWRLEGYRLLARHGTTLPDICLYTGEPTTAGQRMRYPLSWTPVWFRIMAVLAPRLAMVTYSFFRRSSNVEMGMGPAGRRRQRLVLALMVAAVADLLVATAAMMMGIPDGWIVIGILVACFLGLAVAALVTRVFRIVKIDRRYAHLALRPRVAAAFARLPPPPASG